MVDLAQRLDSGTETEEDRQRMSTVPGHLTTRAMVGAIAGLATV